MKITDKFSFFTHEKIGPNLYVVRESFGPESNFNIYVVIGEQSVGVFDTGLGAEDNLRNYIEENILGDFMKENYGEREKMEQFRPVKPINAYMTHVDLDHSGGAALFDAAYLSRKEDNKLEWNLNIERKFSDLNVFCSGNQEIIDYCKQHYIDNRKTDFRDIADGESIYLGGEIFQVIELPGHTPGSVAYYNKEKNYVLTGDAIQLHNSFQRCADLKIILKAYERFLEIVPENVAIYGGHDREKLSVQVVRDILESIREIYAGRTENDSKGSMPFPMVDPEELEYDTKIHEYNGMVIIYNAKAVIR